MSQMKADLENAETELRAKSTELDKLKWELDTLQRDSEVCLTVCNGILSLR